MSVALYSPEDVIILLGGVYQIDGLHEGSFLSITEDGNRYETSVTTDGKVSRTHKKFATHTVSLTLSSVANANDIFSAWAASDGILYGAIIPLMIKDNLGTSLFYSPSCWVEKAPTASFGEAVESREWVLKCAGAFSAVGGNENGTVIPETLAQVGFIGVDFAGLF